MSASNSTVTDSPSDAGPSRTVIIACATVGGVIVLLIAARLIFVLRRRCRRRAKQRPLPPARPTSVAVRFQPHWHQHNPGDGFQQQQQQQQFFPHLLSSAQVSRAASIPSLTAYSSAEDGEMEKNTAGAARSEETALSSPAPDTPPPFDNDTLLPPQPPFGMLKSKRSDDGTSESGSLDSTHNVNITISQNYPPFPTSTHTLSSVSGHASVPGLEGRTTPTTPTFHPNSSQPTTPARPRMNGNSYTTVNNRQRVRPLSTAYSVTSSMSGSGSFAHIPTTTGRRGAPHSRHSRVEIILPTPLAPPGLRDGYGGSGWSTMDTGAATPYLPTVADAMSPSRRASLPVLPRDSSRLSLCDPWLTAGRNASAAGDSHGNGTVTPTRQRRLSRNVDGERSSSRSRSSRRHSASSTTSTGASVAAQLSAVVPRPPVPRIPSMYNPDSQSIPLSHASAPGSGFTGPAAGPAIANADEGLGSRL